MSDALLKFLAGTFLIEIPMIFSWVVFLSASGAFLFSNHRFLKSRTPIFYFLLLGATAAFRFFISFFETFVQYYVWKKNPITNIFLAQPLDANVPIPKFISKIFFAHPHGAFLYYAWMHFFLNVFLSILSAVIFYYFLVFLRKYRERFFGEEEIILGTLMALVVGWPNIVLFVPAALLLTVLSSIVRRAAWGKNYTTLGLPFLVSGFTILLFGKFMIDVFRLGGLG